MVTQNTVRTCEVKKTNKISYLQVRNYVCFTTINCYKILGMCKLSFIGSQNVFPPHSLAGQCLVYGTGTDFIQFMCILLVCMLHGV